MAEFPWEVTSEGRAGHPSQRSLLGEQERVRGTGEFRGMEFIHVNAKSIINEVPSSPLPFRFTINAYRGCSHACTYCFARPTHRYLELDPWKGFDRQIVVKVNAVERLRAELRPHRWNGDGIAMGTNTDPYQRCEGRYRLTRGLVEALVEHANPFSILTKSTLVLRDVDLLAEGARRTTVGVNLSIATLDAEVWQLTEPGTPHPLRRLGAVKALREAGLDCGVLVAPIIPGLSDGADQLDEVVRGAVEAGATSITPVVLHLRPGVKELFLAWLADVRPDLAARHRRLYGDRSTAPAAERQRIGALVHRLVRRHGGVMPQRSPPRPPPAARPERRYEQAAQLRLV
jgi:DNA repair photolyase